MNSAWSRQTNLFAKDANSGDSFGSCLSIDGNVAIIGASGASSNKGAKV
jgi:hypothetical protein